MKMVADRYGHAAYHNKHWLLRNVNIDDFEWPWSPKICGSSDFFWWFLAAKKV